MTVDPAPPLSLSESHAKSLRKMSGALIANSVNFAQQVFMIEPGLRVGLGVG